jgi:hypothetical protein
MDSNLDNFNLDLTGFEEYLSEYKFRMLKKHIENENKTIEQNKWRQDEKNLAEQYYNYQWLNVVSKIATQYTSE